jgi:chemotaxis protein MotB
MKPASLLVLCVLIAGVLLSGCSGNKELIAQKDMQITEMQKEIAGLKSRLGENESQNQQLKGELEAALADYRQKEKIWLQQKDGLTKVTIPDAVTFGASSTGLTEQGKEILGKIWDVLAKYPDRRILIEGHTDNKQIKTEFQHLFKSNWELSSARAHTILHHLVNKHKADPARLTASGYGEFQPIADNGTAEGRAMNRRVVIAVRDKM